MDFVPLPPVFMTGGFFLHISRAIEIVVAPLARKQRSSRLHHILK